VDGTRAQALQTLHNAFEDPYQPQACGAIMILGCIAILEGKMDNLLCDRVMAFLTAPRPVRGVSKVLQSFICTHHLLSSPSSHEVDMHQLAKKHFGEMDGDISPIVITKLTHFIANTLRRAQKSRIPLYDVARRRAFLIRRGKPVPWPEHPRQLIPYGPEDSFRALCSWLLTGARDELLLSMFYLVSVLMVTYGHEVTPYVVTSDILVHMLHGFLAGEHRKWVMVAPELPGRWGKELYSSVRAGSKIHDTKHKAALESLLIGGQFMFALQNTTDQTELANYVKLGFAPEIATTMTTMLAWMTDLRQWALRLRPTQDQQDTLTFAWDAFHSFAIYLYANHEEAREGPTGAIETG
jgi:hypothetical protein